MEPKFILESEGAVAGSSAEWLVSCWQQMGATALFVFIGVFMYFSPLDLKSLLLGNLGYVSCKSPCAKADQPQGVSFRPGQPILQLLKLDCKTQQQLRWQEEHLLSALALAFPLATVAPSFQAQPAACLPPAQQKEKKRGSPGPFVRIQQDQDHF